MRSTSGAAPFLMAGITPEKLRIVTNVRAGTADIRVLLIRLSALGDVVHTLPAAALLRKQLPNAKLTWIVEAPFVELLENNPVIDDVIVFPKKLLAKELKNPLCWMSPSSELQKFATELKRREFTVAIDFQGLFKSGVIAFLSGAPVRIGFSEGRELSPLLMTHKLSGADYFSDDTHVVDHNLDLAEFYLRIAGDTSASAVSNEENKDSVSFSLPAPDAKGFALVTDLLYSEAAIKSHVASSDVGLIDRVSSSTKRTDATSQEKSRSNGATGLDQANRAQTDQSSGATGSVKPNVPPDATGSVNLRASRVISQPPVAPQTAELIRKSKREGETVIVLIPGTTWITKIWPKENWAQLVSQLVRLPDVRIVLVGGPSEVEMNRYIYDSVSNRMPSEFGNSTHLLDLTGKTRLKDLIALFMVSDIVVGADTGPLHMAAATGIPRVLGIFGSTPWKRNGPLGLDTSVVALDLSCQPCFEKICPLGTLACLKDLSVESVYAQVRKILN